MSYTLPIYHADVKVNPNVGDPQLPSTSYRLPP
jgi:hypothetical protein